VAQDLIKTDQDRAGTLPGSPRLAAPPEVPRVGLDPAIAKAVADHPQAGASIALSEAWLGDLAVLVPELGLDARVVVAILDDWFGLAEQLRERGGFEQALQQRQLPQLRELWWRRSVPWLIERLRVHRGARETVEAVVPVVPAAVPLPDAPASATDLAFLKGRR
jgi:hypothetical protein